MMELVPRILEKKKAFSFSLSHLIVCKMNHTKPEQHWSMALYLCQTVVESRLWSRNPIARPRRPHYSFNTTWHYKQHLYRVILGPNTITRQDSRKDDFPWLKWDSCHVTHALVNIGTPYYCPARGGLNW